MFGYDTVMAVAIDMREEFVTPDFSKPLHLGAYLARVPAEATCKGMFFDDIIKAVTKASPQAGAELVPHVARRYVPFRDYPLREHMELTARAVQLLYPALPQREGLRRLGWLAFPAFTESLVGRIIFGILGNDLDKVFELGPRSFSVSLSHGRATAYRIGEAHWQYVFTEVYGFLDAYYVGVLEGPIKKLGKVPQVRLSPASLSEGVMDIRWFDK
jgi:uncharacterized protein (TIGR02265 family)